MRRFHLVAALFLFALTLPYLWALATTPDGFIYGGLLYNPDDQNVHLAWARAAFDGQFFFRDFFTTENLNGETPLFTNLFCWLIGTLSRITHLPLVVVYHLARVVFAFLALRWFFALCALWTSDKRARFLALVFMAFSGGAGWLVFLFPNRTWIDRADGNLMMPEAWTFTSALIFPLYIASMALLIFVFLQVELARRTSRMKHAIFAALAAFLLTNIHTYDAIPLGIILLAWSVKSTPLFGRTFGEERISSRLSRLAPIVALCGTIPPILYQLYVFKNSSEFQIKALTKTAAPPLGDVLLSYSPLLILAVAGLILSRKMQIGRVALLWFLVTFLCVYAPVSFSRKMIEGLHLPLCFLAALGASALLDKVSVPMARRALAAIGVIVLSTSSFNFVAWCLSNASDNNRSRTQFLMPPLYLARDDHAALQWISANAPQGRAVLCLPFLGNYAPRETGRNVYVGHRWETLNFGRKLADTLRFFGLGESIRQSNMEADQARRFLRDNRIGVVVIGSYEKDFGARLPLNLKLLHQTGNTGVYAVE